MRRRTRGSRQERRVSFQQEARHSKRPPGEGTLLEAGGGTSKSGLAGACVRLLSVGLEHGPSCLRHPLPPAGCLWGCPTEVRLARVLTREGQVGWCPRLCA